MILGNLLPGCEAVPDPLLRTDQRDLVDQRIGHCRFSLLPLPRKVQILDLHGCSLVAETLGQVVVIVLRARAHAADVERELGPDCITAGREILAHADTDVGRQIEIGEGLAVAGLGNPSSTGPVIAPAFSGDMKIGSVPSATSPAV